METDLINHPDHYENAAIRLQPLHFCERLRFNLGNALKYAFRYQNKGNPEQDLKKCLFYLAEHDSDREPQYTKREMHEFCLMIKFLCLSGSRPICCAAKENVRIPEHSTPSVKFRCFWIALRTEVEKILEEIEKDKAAKQEAEKKRGRVIMESAKPEGKYSTEEIKTFANLSDALLGTSLGSATTNKIKEKINAN
jgi:hypothetical protein